MSYTNLVLPFEKKIREKKEPTFRFQENEKRKLFLFSPYYLTEPNQIFYTNKNESNYT